MHGSRLTNHLVTEAVGLFSACIFRNVNLGESCDPASGASEEAMPEKWLKYH